MPFQRFILLVTTIPQFSFVIFSLAVFPPTRIPSLNKAFWRIAKVTGTNIELKTIGIGEMMSAFVACFTLLALFLGRLYSTLCLGNFYLRRQILYFE